MGCPEHMVSLTSRRRWRRRDVIPQASGVAGPAGRGRACGTRLRAAFTLVELLVVIAIVAVLMAILIPSLRQARDHAVRVSCMSMQRQLYLAGLSFGNDNDYYLPYGFGGSAYWGYWEANPLVQHPTSPRSLYRVGDWDTVWAGDSLGGFSRKGNNGRGGQLAPYMQKEKSSGTNNTGTGDDAWRTLCYRLPGGSYQTYYLPRRVATCPGVRPLTDNQSSSAYGTYALDAYMLSGQKRLADNREFFPSYGINPFISSEGSKYWAQSTATRWYHQYKLSQIENPGRIILFSDRPHALMDYQVHSMGTAQPGMGVGFLAPQAHMLPDLFAPVGAGAFGPYAPEPRHGKLVAVFVDGHAESMLWSNYRKDSSGGVSYEAGRAFPGSGYDYPQYVWEGIYTNDEYHDLPFVNRRPGD